MLVTKTGLFPWESQPNLNKSNEPSNRRKNPISSKWIQPVACCVWLWPKSQPAGSGSPCHQCLSESRHFSLYYQWAPGSGAGQTAVKCWQWAAAQRPVRGSRSVFKGPKNCRKTVFLTLLSGMYEKISDLAALTAHRKLDPDRNRMWNKRRSHPWV